MAPGCFELQAGDLPALSGHLYQRSQLGGPIMSRTAAPAWSRRGGAGRGGIQGAARGRIVLCFVLGARHDRSLEEMVRLAGEDDVEESLALVLCFA